MSEKDEKAPGFSENHVISADNKEKSELFNSFYLSSTGRMAFKLQVIFNSQCKVGVPI